MPRLATTYAYFISFFVIHREGSSLQKQLAAGDLSHLTDFHAIVAGLKAFSTWFALDTIERCRQTCGGQFVYLSLLGIRSLLTRKY